MSNQSTGVLERLFHLSENNTTVKRECLAGLTTFVSMAYILFVNPIILGDAGMDAGAVFTATALSAIMGCLLMGFLANYPIAIAPGLGDNAFFTYSVVLAMGIPSTACHCPPSSPATKTAAGRPSVSSATKTSR